MTYDGTQGTHSTEAGRKCGSCVRPSVGNTHATSPAGLDKCSKHKQQESEKVKQGKQGVQRLVSRVLTLFNVRTSNLAARTEMDTDEFTLLKNTS